MSLVTDRSKKSCLSSEIQVLEFGDVANSGIDNERKMIVLARDSNGPFLFGFCSNPFGFFLVFE